MSDLRVVPLEVGLWRLGSGIVGEGDAMTPQPKRRDVLKIGTGLGAFTLAH